MNFPFGTICLAMIIIVGHKASASPQGLGYQGRIVHSNGSPLEYSSVSFQFQITDPSGQCIIYKEQINGINMINSGGLFDVPIGSGSVIYPTTGSFKILDAFNNTSSFACLGGATYNASQGDLRKLQVQFHDGTGWNQITPDSVIRSVPFAAYSLAAEKLGTKTAADFVLKTGVPNCIASGKILSADANGLTCVTDQSGTGPLAGDVTGNQGTTKVVALQNKSISTTAPTDGQVLQWNNTSSKWEPTTLAAGSGGSITGVTAGTGLTGGGSSGTVSLSVNAGVTANKIVQLDNSAKLPAVDGSALSNLNPNSLLTAVPISKGGTGATSIAANRIIASDATGSSFVPFSCGIGQLLTFNATGVMGCTSYSATNFFMNGGNNFGVTADLGTNDNNVLNLKTNGSTKMTVMTDGKVGIGTTSPMSLLDVVTNDSSINFVASRNLSSTGGAGFYTASDTNYMWMGIYNTVSLLQTNSTNGLAISTLGNSPITFSTNGGSNERLRVNADGNIGVGTSNPKQLLHLYSAKSSIINTYGSDSFQNGINMGEGDTNRWMILQDTSSNDRVLSFSRDHTGVGGNAGAVMTMTDTGSVGIGTRTPASTLDVSGDVKLGNSATVCSATNEGAQRYNSTTKTMQFCNGTIWSDISSAPQHIYGSMTGNCSISVTADSGGYVDLCSYTFTPTKSGVASIETFLQDVFVAAAGTNGSFGFKTRLNGVNGSDNAALSMTAIYRFGVGEVFFPTLVDHWNVTAGTSYTLTIQYFSQNFAGGLTVNTSGNSSIKHVQITIY